jgi:sugar/nucleoside kinase (ribokinase family)
MSQYNVYGLGNALVDYEYKVTPEWLAEVGIDKGVMTLMDEEQQAKVIAAIDSEAIKRASGGSGANSIIALAQMGGKAYYTCKVAADEDGHFYAKDMAGCGVASNLAPQDASQGITGKCLVLVTDDADRTMCTFLGITGELAANELDLDALANSEYLYLEGYLVTSDSAREAAVTARKAAEQAGVKTAISLADPNMVAFFKEGLQAMIGEGVDLLFANEDEATGMTGTETAEQAAEELKKIAKTFAITRGAEGSLVFDGKKLINIAPVATTAVDTLGAGDMFAGAFLYAITQGMSYENAGKLASLASSRMVTKFGPRFETEETLAILAEFSS